MTPAPVPVPGIPLSRLVLFDLLTTFSSMPSFVHVLSPFGSRKSFHGECEPAVEVILHLFYSPLRLLPPSCALQKARLWFVRILVTHHNYYPPFPLISLLVLRCSSGYSSSSQLVVSSFRLFPSFHHMHRISCRHKRTLTRQKSEAADLIPQIWYAWR